MIKKSLLTLTLAIALSATLSSCYTYTTVVGNGPSGVQETQAWNHYLIFGLVPVGVSNPTLLSNGAKDYSVTTKQSFLNGLVSGLTFGIYSPTTTVITQ